jgi:hypothetical protein
MGGVMSLAFTLAGIYSTWFSGNTGMDHAKNYFWAGAALCFIFANYKIWEGEHAKVVSTNPNLALRVEQINWEPSADGKTTVLSFAVNLLNKGAPTVTRGWGGSIEFRAGGRERLAPFLFSGTWTISNGGQYITLYPKDQIQAKTLERRLETGEAKMGRIFFNLDGDRIDQLKAANFVATIYCHDFLGKRADGVFHPHGALLTGVARYPDEEGGFVTSPKPKPDTPKLDPPED